MVKRNAPACSVNQDSFVTFASVFAEVIQDSAMQQSFSKSYLREQLSTKMFSYLIKLHSENTKSNSQPFTSIILTMTSGTSPECNTHIERYQ
jgi:hypothetical protein